MLHQQVLDEEEALIVFSFLVNPEFLLGDVQVSVMLAEIRELLIDMPADVCTIDYPDLIVPTHFIHL
jgi:hypothetical protein